jgi:hypothetical protein
MHKFSLIECVLSCHCTVNIDRLPVESLVYKMTFITKTFLFYEFTSHKMESNNRNRNECKGHINYFLLTIIRNTNNDCYCWKAEVLAKHYTLKSN